MITKERILYWKDDFAAVSWVRQGAKDEFQELCNLALANLEGEEVYTLVRDDGVIEPHHSYYSKNGAEHIARLSSLKGQKWKARPFRLVPVEGER